MPIVRNKIRESSSWEENLTLMKGETAFGAKEAIFGRN